MVAKRSDVARLAGTSPAVVSYVLNNGPRPVAPATRERVLTAVDQLGYRPNRVASSLRTNRTMTLGLVVPDNTNPYFAELARAIEDAAFAAGYTLFLGNAVDDRDRELAYVRAFIDLRVDGIMVIPSASQMRGVEELAKSQTPWVVLDREIPCDSAAAVILSDNFAGGKLATEHLIWHGRRTLACIAGPAYTDQTASQRVLGWRAALAQAPFETLSAPLMEVAYGRFEARDAALDLLARFPQTDAIFVASDEQAQGVLRALAELGLSCPADIALVSFDDVRSSQLSLPSLSSVRQPRTEIARLALASLVDLDSTGRSGPPPQTVLPVELIRRGSCGCPDPTNSSPSNTGATKGGPQ